AVKQVFLLNRRLIVIEGLIMRKRHGRIENMNHASHTSVNKTSEPEVAGYGERHTVGLALGHSTTVYAGGAIERGAIRCRAWTAHLRGRSELIRSQKRHGVDLVHGKVPLDSVAGVDPDLVGKKGQYLNSLTLVLCSRSGVT